MKVVVIVLNKVEVLDSLLEKFMENGITGATIIHSTGMAQELMNSNELNIIYSIRNLIAPDRKENVTIYSVVKDELVEKISEIVDKEVGGLNNPNTGVLFTVPVDYCRGLD